MGADGAFAASPQGTWTVQALPITAVDTTAAGDAFVGVFAASLAKDMTLDESLRRATVASGLACTSVGAQTSLPDAQQVEQYLPLVPAPRRGV